MNFLKDLTDLVFLEDLPQKADIIFVPGGSFGILAKTAAKLYHQGLAPYILPSGRFSKLTGHFDGSKDAPPIFPQEHFDTEWDFLCRILKAEGVPKTAILREDEATYTYENAIYSRQVTDALGLSIHKAIICCQAYHSRRCRLYYEIMYPETQFFICPTVTQDISRDNWYTDAKKIDTVLSEIEKLGAQFHQIVRQYGIPENTKYTTKNREDFL